MKFYCVFNLFGKIVRPLKVYVGLSTGRVCAQPGTDPTRSGGQTFNPPPTVGEVGSDGLEHQRAAVGFGRSRDLENKENPAKMMKIGQIL